MGEYYEEWCDRQAQAEIHGTQKRDELAAIERQLNPPVFIRDGENLEERILDLSPGAINDGERTRLNWLYERRKDSEDILDEVEAEIHSIEEKRCQRALQSTARLIRDEVAVAFDAHCEATLLTWRLIVLVWQRMVLWVKG